MAKKLPPWMEKAKAEGAKERATGKSGSKAHEKGESAKFKAAEKGKPFANGGKVKGKC